MTLPENVERLLNQRYYQPDEDWPLLVDRVVEHVCRDESAEFRYRVWEYIHDRVFLPNSPVLVNSGTKTGGGFACFVVGPEEDTLESHAEALKDIAEVGKRGGGCGFTGSFIRPEGSPVAGSAHGFAYGPNRWAIQVEQYLDMITQGGFRKMALMFSLASWHPDLLSFINLKQTGDESFARRFNQSVMADNKFMEAAINGEDYELYFRDEEGRTISEDTVNAGEVLDLIAKNAWNNGEPGLLFYDTANLYTPYNKSGQVLNTTNPCGEQWLPEYGSCNLGSINLAHDRFFKRDESYDYDALWLASSHLAQFLDNVGNVNIFPNKKFEKWYKRNRPIGIGIMGFADALLRMEIAYGSDGSIDFLETALKTIYDGALQTSTLLGRIRGVPHMARHVNRRNITLLSIAPTGSIAFIAGCSHGIEPIFSPDFVRTDERGEKYTFTHPKAEEPYFRSTINPDPSKVPTWKQHIDIQAASQKYVDSSVSKTINLPNDASVEDVKEAMVYAWRKQCKGITLYRDGSRQTQVLNDTSNKKKEVKGEVNPHTGMQKIVKTSAPKRPSLLPCNIMSAKIEGEDWVIAVGFMESDPYELFAFKGSLDVEDAYILKQGSGVYDLVTKDGETIMEDIVGSYRSDEEQALTRAISLALRHGADPFYVVSQLEKAKGTVTSFSHAVRRALKKYVSVEMALSGKVCPNCKSENLTMQEGCETCLDCGYGKCG